MSNDVNMSRGVRQGCPISALLYILSTEIMNIKFGKTQAIKGIQIGKKGKKLFAYADDTTFTFKVRNQSN